MIPTELIPYQNGYRLVRKMNYHDWKRLDRRMQDEGYRYTGSGIWRPSE